MLVFALSVCVLKAKCVSAYLCACARVRPVSQGHGKGAGNCNFLTETRESCTCSCSQIVSKKKKCWKNVCVWTRWSFNNPTVCFFSHVLLGVSRTCPVCVLKTGLIKGVSGNLATVDQGQLLPWWMVSCVVNYLLGSSSRIPLRSVVTVIMCETDPDMNSPAWARWWIL